MPPTRLFNPKSLEKLCLDQLVIYFGKEMGFCAQVRKYEKESLLLRRRGICACVLEKEMESQLGILPPLLNEMVRQHITNEVLKANSKSILSQQEIYLGLLNILLNKDIKVLEFGANQLSFECAIWSIIVKRCTGLKRLALNTEKGDVPVRHWSHKQRFLRKVVINCPSLVELVVKDVVDGYETLSVIGKHCPNLKLLDISGSRVNCFDLTHLLLSTHQGKNFNIDVLIDGSFELPCNPLCQTLEVLNLFETSVKSKGCALALKTLPNLVTLGNCIHLPAAVKRLYGSKTKPNVPLKITQACFDGPSHSKLKAMANCCPALESLNISGEKLQGIAPSCMVYKNLRRLSLENVEFHTFIACGSFLSQITELKLSAPGTDVGLVGKYCVNLEKFWLCYMARPQSRPPDCVPFSKLKKLKIRCITPVGVLSLIAKHAHNIRVIDVLRVEDLDDSILAEWFQWNSFLHLETLMIRYADLSRTSIDMLLANCPKLTKIGELGGWDIRSWDCRRLKDLVIRENYNLDLVLCSQNADSIIIDILSGNGSSEEEVM